MIVVFGGAGFVGTAVAEFYATRGNRVRVIDNRSRASLLRAEGDLPLSNWDWVAKLPGVEMIDASILDANLLPELVEGAEGIVHAAAQTAVTVSVEDPRTDFLVNTVGTFNVLEATRAAAPQAPVIFCSTNKVYGANAENLPTRKEEKRYALEGEWQQGIPETLSIDLCEHSPYGVSKTAADLYVQEYGHLYGVPTVVFRMSCIYGPRQWGVSDQGWIAWFAKAMLTGDPITIYGDGRQVRDVLFVTDLVEAMDAAMNSGFRGEVFNIGGGPDNTLSLLDAIEILEQATGRKADIRFGEWRPSDQRVYVSNIEKARRMLGWEPTVAPQKGIAVLIEWLSAQRELRANDSPVEHLYRS
jgi:CDP-paratose 2-epimerase